MVWAFAEKYPEVAGRLLLEPTKCEDPHVERLIEAFAMMAARIQLRLDDDFSEVSDTLLGLLYPHLLSPIPSRDGRPVLARSQRWALRQAEP